MRISVIFITFLFLTLSPLLAQKKPRTGKEPLLGKEYAAYKITSNELSGACFYLVSGHGGPDPGADIFARYADRKAGITRNVLIDKTGKIVMLTRLYNEEEFSSLCKKIDEMLGEK